LVGTLAPPIIDDRVKVEVHAEHWDPKKQIFEYEVKIQSKSRSPIYEPLWLEVTRLAPTGGIAVVRPTGTTPEGNPYVEVDLKSEAAGRLTFDKSVEGALFISNPQGLKSKQIQLTVRIRGLLMP